MVTLYKYTIRSFFFLTYNNHFSVIFEICLKLVWYSELRIFILHSFRQESYFENFNIHIPLERHPNINTIIDLECCHFFNRSKFSWQQSLAKRNKGVLGYQSPRTFQGCQIKYRFIQAEIWGSPNNSTLAPKKILTKLTHVARTVSKV